MHKVHVGRSKHRHLIAVSLLILVCLSLQWNSKVAVYAQSDLTASQDTFVDINEESSAHDNQDLVVAFSNFPSFKATKRALIQFDLSGVTSPLTGAPLVLQLIGNGLSADSVTLTLYQLSDSWSATVTNDNAPGAGSSLQSTTLAADFTGEVRFTNSSIGTYLEAQRNGDGKASFLLALTTGPSGFGTNFVFADSESGNGPQIEVPAPPTATSTATATKTATATVPTNTPTATKTATATVPTNTPTATKTATATMPTNTPTVTKTATATMPTNTPTVTKTGTVTPATATPTPSATSTTVAPTATTVAPTTTETPIVPTSTATVPVTTETPIVPTSTATVPVVTETAVSPTATATTAAPTATATTTPIGTTPTPIVVNVDPALGATLTYTDPSSNTILIEVPAGAVDAQIQLVLQPTTPSSGLAGFAFIGESFTLDAFNNGSLLDGFSFKKPVVITITYKDASIVGLDEASLLLYFYNEATQQWIDAATTCTPPSVYDRNLDANHFTVGICHLTEFAVFGKTFTSLYLPLVHR